jgi:hypothetical protein
MSDMPNVPEPVAPLPLLRQVYPVRVSTAGHCPLCGTPVRVVSSGEGTSHYEPVGEGAE